MKPFALALIAFLASPALSRAEHYQVYLLGGQSNAAGRADAAQLAPPLSTAQADVRFYWHRTASATNVGHLPEDQWIDLAPGSGHGTAAPVFPKEFGSELSFGRTMADAQPAARIAIIKYAHGGTNLHTQWAAGGVQYTTFVTTVRTALNSLTATGHTYDLRGMLWQQGENDTGEPAASDYQANLTSLIGRVRTDLNGGLAFPFVIGSLSNSQYGNITTVGSGPYKVRRAQEAVAAADPTVGIVITDGYSVRSDVIHFDHAGMMALGRNFASGITAVEGPDVTSPLLSGTVPVNGAVDVNPSANLVAVFDEGMALTGTGTVTLRNLGSGADTGITLPDSQVSVSGKQLIISPASDLLPGNLYAVRISANALTDRATAPNGFAGIGNDTTWSFSTSAPDTVPPEILALSPSDNATQVAVDASLVVTFSENVEKGSGGSIVIKDGLGSVFETIPVTDARVSVSGAVMTVNPTGFLSFNTGYHVQIAAGAIRDHAGDPWTGIAGTDSTSWNFTTTAPPGTSAGTTGVFDENTTATNQLDQQIPANTLASFKTAVLEAYSRNLGGVIDWEKGITTNPSNGGAANNLITAVNSRYGAAAANTMSIMFDHSMDLYTNNINGQVTVLSQGAGSTPNAIVSGGATEAALAYTMTFIGAPVVEIGAAVPSRSSYGALGVNFRATATYSGGGSGALDFTVGRTSGASDTFVHFAAPRGESITSLGFQFVDDNGQGLTTGQRRPCLDDVGFIVAPPPVSYAGWIAGYAVGSLDGFHDDADGDGIGNGIENFFGTAPDGFSSGLVPLAFDTHAGIFTLTHPQGPPATDVAAFYEWSTNMRTFQAAGATDSMGTKVDFTATPDGNVTTVVAIITGTPAKVLFMRVSVIQQ